MDENVQLGHLNQSLTFFFFLNAMNAQMAFM